MRAHARLRAAAKPVAGAGAARSALVGGRQDRPDLQILCKFHPWRLRNWLIDAATPDNFCLACRHNSGIIPDLSQQANLANWQKIEIAKHRLIYTLRRLNLPLQTRTKKPARSSSSTSWPRSPNDPNTRIMTGRDSGTITLALAEADDVERERRRSGKWASPIAALLGHFRHEVGHYFWDQSSSAIRAPGGVFHRAVRRLQRAIMSSAFAGPLRRKAHQRTGRTTLSAPYATVHSMGRISPRPGRTTCTSSTRSRWRARSGSGSRTGAGRHRRARDHHRLQPVPHPRLSKSVVDAWLPLAFALNNINRSMGQPDLYPSCCRSRRSPS